MLTVLNKAQGTVVCESLQMYLSPGERRSLGDVSPEVMRMRCPELESLESRGHVLLIVEPAEPVAVVAEVKAPEVTVQPEALAAEPAAEPAVEATVPQALEEPLSEVAVQPKKAKSKSSK